MDLTKELLVLTGVFMNSPSMEQIEEIKEKLETAELTGKKLSLEESSIELTPIEARVCFPVSELKGLEESSTKDQFILEYYDRRIQVKGDFEKFINILTTKYGFNVNEIC